jgi:hypothetical protein
VQRAIACQHLVGHSCVPQSACSSTNETKRNSLETTKSKYGRNYCQKKKNDDCLFFCFENFRLCWLGFFGFDTIEKFVVYVIRYVHFAHVDFCSCCNHIFLVYASQWATIDFVWASDQQQAGLQLFQEHDTLEKSEGSAKNKNRKLLAIIDDSSEAFFSQIEPISH